MPPPAAVSLPDEPPPVITVPADVPQREADPAARDPGPGDADFSDPVTVALIYSGNVVTQAVIADLIGESLAGSAYSMQRIDIDADRPTLSDTGADARVRIVAAVGPPALAVAQERFPQANIIASYILATGEGNESPKTRRVAPMPPPTLQFAAWSEIDPALRRIGLITSQNMVSAARSAKAGASSIGAELVHRVSTSDRETLYLFRRLAPDIDGLWLAPDSEILSPVVIDEILSLAAEFGVGVLVFSESLLDRGGLVSVSAAPEHIADMVVDTIGRIRFEGADTVPPEIALREGEVRVNLRVVETLDLPRDTSTEWVIRDRP
jgi:hypothetical protein